MKKNILFIILAIATNIVNAQWVQQTSGTVDHLWGISFPSATVGYVSANGGYLLKTINGGSNWNPVPCSCGAPYFTSIDTGYASAIGGILKTEDGGSTWIDNFSFTNIYNCNIHFPTKNVGYAIGQNASIDSLFTYKTINAGASWTLTNSFASSFYEPRNIFFSDAMTGSMILNGSGIYKTTDEVLHGFQN